MRWSGVYAALGGLLWAGGGLLQSALGARTQGASGSPGAALAAVLLTVATLLLAAALPGLALRWERAVGRHGCLGLRLALVGLAAAAAAHLLPALPSVTGWLPPLLLASGLLTLSAGLLLFGNAALAGSAEAGWQALPGLLGMLGLFLPMGAGVAGLAGTVVWVLYGVGWCWLGLMLALERTPVRVSVRRR